MQENSIYSVISPEGCASILWRDPSKSLEAADALKLTSKELLKIGIIDEVIDEPLGGAHREPELIVEDVKLSIIKNLRSFDNLSKEEIYDHRKSKYLKIGRDQGFSKSSNLSDINLSFNLSKIQTYKSHLLKNKYIYLGISLVVFVSIVSLLY